MAATLQKVRAQLAAAEERLEAINQELAEAQDALTEAGRGERLNRTTGIGEDVQGNSIAVLDLTVISAARLPKMDRFSGKADPYVIVELEPADACPAFEQQRTETRWKELDPSWHQHFVMRPIVSRAAVVKLTVMDAEKLGTDDYIGQVEIPLDSLLSQELEEVEYPILDALGEGNDVGNSRLRVSHVFTFSRIVPLEHAVNRLLPQQQECETELARLRATAAGLEKHVASSPAAGAAAAAAAAPGAGGSPARPRAAVPARGLAEGEATGVSAPAAPANQQVRSSVAGDYFDTSGILRRRTAQGGDLLRRPCDEPGFWDGLTEWLHGDDPRSMEERRLAQIDIELEPKEPKAAAGVAGAGGAAGAGARRK